MLKVYNISKSFGDKTVLDSFSHTFNKGTTTLITGASGSGKTTLLRIIAGLETADFGEIITDDKATVGMMFQEARLLPWKNVYENIAAVTKKGTPAGIDEILKKLGLSGEGHSLPYKLSGGMRRRVALARTLLFPADIYLFDEPFTGLDAETAHKAAQTIREYTEGKTVIIVSHDTSMFDDTTDIVAI